MFGLDRFSGQLLSILRIVTALLFMAHGTGKLFQFPPVAEFPHGPAPMTLAWFAGIIELVGGALLTVGLFSRLAAFIVSGEMAVAYWMVHAPQATYPIQNHGELAIMFCFVFVYIAAAGSGPWSLDAALRKKA